MFELIYWPTLQGRGEFVRLVLEATGTPYRDVAREPVDGKPHHVQAIFELLKAEPRVYAVPALRVVDGEDSFVLSQTAVIVPYLGERLGFAPDSERDRLHARQLQLTIADCVAEAHDTHHPVSTALYYEDQKDEARAAAQSFIDNRLPKFLAYFERNIAGPHLFGDQPSYVDTSLLQLLLGLQAAFGKATARYVPRFPKLLANVAATKALARVEAYLASERRIAFNEHGIFRPYPELDLPPSDASDDTAT